jgi:polyisoprenoid-binding protein YceI
MKFVTTAIAAAAFGLGASAAAQDVPSGTYKLDPAHTTVVWGVSHAGFSTYRGSFEGIEGELTWNADNPTKSALTVAIEAESVDSPEAESHAGYDNFQQDIARKALGSQEHPTITLRTTRLEKTGEKEGKLYGELTMNGQTNPIEMDVTLAKAGDFMGTPKLGFSGKTTIDRTKWGSDAWTQFGIGTDVTITVESEFAKAE